MATLSHSDSVRMYSWWWDSHISPKSSKWLQENLTDMDEKIKGMIRIINEDADSFARRAEMYYRKRPELMKLVEEFYRAYRALAERYDHATGVIRHAHQTMAEAFPNQVPLILADDSPINCTFALDPGTPQVSSPPCAPFDVNHFQMDALAFSSSHFHEVDRNLDESDSIDRRKEMKQLDDKFDSEDQTRFSEGRARKGLNFDELQFKQEGLKSNENGDLYDSEKRLGVEKEILTLKEILAQLEAEKNAGLVQYQKCLETLAKLESEFSRAQEDSKALSAQASKTEAEVQTLKEALIKLETEKEVNLLQYQQYLDKVSHLENIVSHAQKNVDQLNQRACKAETEALSLAQDLGKVKSEKDAALDQYKQSLEMIAKLDNKLKLAEGDAGKLRELFKNAETEVAILKQDIAQLKEEKEALAFQHERCLETISSLEHKLSCAQEEAQRLHEEIHDRVTKLKGAEERCLILEQANQSLNSELGSLVLKMDSQSQELSEKQRELGRLWTCIQEERVHFMEAETAFQTLQLLHAQAQEELRSLAAELENRAQSLREIETQKQSLEDQILNIKEENRSLNELNASSALSVKDLQTEIFSLRETKVELEQEVVLRMDQRNALQKEIYRLKEELNELNKEHQNILEQLEAVGLSPNCLQSSVKNLLNEKLNLKETYLAEKNEKALAKKLKVLEQLRERNSYLENSLSDLGAELETVRGKLKALEESCESLLEEKSVLIAQKTSAFTQLQFATQDLSKLSEKNIDLENSMSDVNCELEGLKAKSKSLEDSCQVLVNQNAVLANERDSLHSQLDTTSRTLENLGKTFAMLQEKCLVLKTEKESAVRKVEALEVSVDAEKQKQGRLVQMLETELAGKESKIDLLQAECHVGRRFLEKEQDEAFYFQMENFILRRCALDLDKDYFGVLEENRSLTQLVLLLEKKLHNLKIEKCGDTVSMDTFSPIIWDYLDQKSHELKELFEDFQKIHAANGTLLDKLSSIEKKFEGVQMENMNLKETLQIENMNLKETLQMVGKELRTIAAVTHQLNCEILGVKDHLFLKDRECLEAEQRLSITENEKSMMCDTLENLRRDCNEVKIISENQEIQIRELSKGTDSLKHEFDGLCEANRHLELKLLHLRKESETQRTQEQILCSELQKERNEVKLWEMEAASSFCQLQISSTLQCLFKEKFHEIAQKCELLEDERNLKCKDLDFLKGRVGILEVENEGFKTQLVASSAAFDSLRNCISSLENSIRLHPKVGIPINEETKDAESSCHLHDDHNGEKNYNALDVFSGLEDLQSRIQAIENALQKVEQPKMDSNPCSEKEAAMKQIEELKSENNYNVTSIGSATEIPGTDTLLVTKDIMLDHISKCSSYRKNERQAVEADNLMLELWETSNQEGNIDLTVSKAKKVVGSYSRSIDHEEIDQLKKHKRECSIAEILAEKEMGVDNLKSCSSKESVGLEHEGNKRKVLERLSSDIQKLTNLQITLKDLRRKFSSIEERKSSKSFQECNTLKEQLEEAEEAIQKLFNLNSRLTKTVKNSFFSDEMPAVGCETSGNNRTKRLSDQARRMSEKIGRLQLEIQKMQFVMLKLDDEKESIKTRIPINRRKVLLRDYLYGGVARSHKQKKAPFCACV